MRRLRILSTLGIVAALVAVLAAPALAAPSFSAPAQVQLPTLVIPTLPPLVTQSPNLVRGTVDTELSAHQPRLTTFQESYLAATGRYFQALASHSSAPADGNVAVPDRLTAGPTDQAETCAFMWQQLALAGALNYSTRVDVYDGPQGKGYLHTVSVILSGQLWERTLNTGPEAYREAAWHPVVP